MKKSYSVTVSCSVNVEAQQEDEKRECDRRIDFELRLVKAFREAINQAEGLDLLEFLDDWEED